MTTVPSSWKDCVTCDRWGGHRKPTPFRDGVEFDPSHDNGECLGGGWDRMQMGSTQTCNRYEKWRVLSGLSERVGRRTGMVNKITTRNPTSLP
jgi:hypothetical protein